MFPNQYVVRTVLDYLFSIDPSGQFLHGYNWSFCNQRPDDIYNVHGSGQCLNAQGIPSGSFKSFASEYVKTVRAPVYRHPLYIAGPGYDILGKGFGLTEVIGNQHSVFFGGTAIVPYNNPNTSMSEYRSAPVDLRYDSWRGVWTCPYNAFPVEIQEVAPSGKAFNYKGDLVNTEWNHYEVTSGTYRYAVIANWHDTGYGPADINLERYLHNGSGFMNNSRERNGDLPFLRPYDHVIAFVNPISVASGTLLCSASPVAFARFHGA